MREVVGAVDESSSCCLIRLGFKQGLSFKQAVRLGFAFGCPAREKSAPVVALVGWSVAPIPHASDPGFRWSVVTTVDRLRVSPTRACMVELRLLSVNIRRKRLI